MDLDAVRALLDRQLRRAAPPDSAAAQVERTGGVVRQTGGPTDWNGILWSELTEATADAAIAAQVRHFAAMDREFEWTVYAHDRPADLAARLRAAGFQPEPAETLMVAEVAGLPKEVELPPDVRLLPVTDPAGVELLVRVHEEVFGAPGGRLRDRLLARLAADPDALALTVVMAADEPVSGARLEWVPGTDFAGLWGGGTLSAWRGRGIYRALIAHRARLAAERGVRYLRVDASDQSRPILRRLGFAELSTATPYLHRP
ncbi:MULTISPECIES: GNAT family N-acetyltransferase [Streptomyces]|uniref:GNAT family N-acetyltransferase n=1 Tax=Streptomyces TaxID=1883 RepID=UPI00069AE011|nr:MULTISPECIES: GNAT family N-acetyltransferase [Streptomyces]MYU55508.1 GNAT family N-acetyltransferase [Streptomyces sp. SID7805]